MEDVKIPDIYHADAEQLDVLDQKIRQLPTTSPDRATLLSHVNSRLQTLRAPKPEWHTDCCCTSEDRRYGMGCR